MKPRRRFKPIHVACLLGGAALTAAAVNAAPLDLTNVPLFTLNRGTANVLMMFGNSNSMDEDPAGRAVGSDSPESRSEIARNAIKDLVRSYTGRINMGLLAYQQVTSGAHLLEKAALHESPYDLSFDPAKYDPGFDGPRESAQKKFRVANPTSPGDYLYFNVNLPLYDSKNLGNGFCYSATAHAFSNDEDPIAGPWDHYTCYSTKRGTSDALPTDSASAMSAGYSDYRFSSTIKPSDSDLGQGITDFGTFQAWAYVGPTWFSNGSPGKGFVHVPVKPLNATHANWITRKLGTSQFRENKPFDSDYPLQNAGLTPLEGTMQTALSYFKGTLKTGVEGWSSPYPAASTCDKNFVAMLTNGLPSVTAAGVPSSDTGAMLGSLSTAVKKLHDARVTTYVVGFALPYGVNPSQLQTIADAGVGGEAGAGTVYYATNRATLYEQLNAVFDDIVRQLSAGSAVVLNSRSVSLNTRVYQARFNSTDWSGQLLSIPIDPATGAQLPDSEYAWDAAQMLNTLSATDRTIVTYRPSSREGVPFRWPDAGETGSSLDDSQAAALDANPVTGSPDGLGEARLEYLRGESSGENAAPNDFRIRAAGKLGDIVNSAPAFIGAPAFNYPDASYPAFRASNATRPAMIYVGANDGMLHGFDANTGIERIAYVPSRVYPKLNQLTYANYDHSFYVDGTVNYGDVYYAGGWHTVVVSGLGAGGRGIFALDVTNPAAFSERTASSIVNFEYSDADDADVGHVTGLTNVVKLNNGKWAAVFGNGYNSTGSGKPTLFVVDIHTGALISKLTTGTGTPTTPNALTSATAIDTDGNRAIDVVYGGDLLGNLWKFDLSDADPAKWHVAFSDAPLYTARDSSDNPQPITTAPEVGRHPKGGYMVYFGTGKYLEMADLTNTAQNTVYGVRDNGHPVGLPLLEQQVTGTTTVSSGGTSSKYRTVSQNSLDWSTRAGWFINLPVSGERAVTDPILYNGRLIFTTLTPATSSCYGGSSWLMEIDYLSGAQISLPVLDTNLDSKIDSDDIPVAGWGSDTISAMPGILSGFGSKANPLDKKYLNQSDGTLTTLTERGNSLASRRTAWQELPLP